VDPAELEEGGRLLRTPRAAAIAGIVFALLLGIVQVLIKQAIPSTAATPGAWLTDSHRRASVVLALDLVPFAGIAFLWFVGVVRDRLGGREDRFFATVFLGSGLLFVAMLFVGAAVAGGLVADASIRAGHLPSAGNWDFGRRVTGVMLNVYALRMAAVFVLSTTTIGLKTQILPRWLGYLGYIVALALLIGVGLSAWSSLLFPLWILALSIHILVAGFHAATPHGPQA
jgi:hypothetical protein